MADPTRTRHIREHEADRDGVQWKRWLLGIAVVVLLVIVLQNAQTVKFHILFVSTSAPLIVLLLIAALLGAVIGYMAPILRRHRRNERRQQD